MAYDSTIAIVDDNDSMRLLTGRLLRRDHWLVADFASGDRFLAEPNLRRFACILLDVRMPGMDGIAVLRALRERQAVPPVLVVTGHGDIQLAVQAMKLGAVDFIEKPYQPKDLLAAIRGAIAAHEELAGGGGEAAAAVGSLTQRQREVLCGILQGNPNKIIAWELGLSIRTVEAYRAQLLEKLGVRSTAAAVRMAIAANLDCAPPGARAN